MKRRLVIAAISGLAFAALNCFPQSATVTTNANGSLTVVISGPVKPQTVKLTWDAAPGEWKTVFGYVTRVIGPSARYDTIYTGMQRSLVVSNMVSGQYYFSTRSLNVYHGESDPAVASYAVPAGPSFRLSITTENLN